MSHNIDEKQFIDDATSSLVVAPKPSGQPTPTNVDIITVTPDSSKIQTKEITQPTGRTTSATTSAFESTIPAGNVTMPRIIYQIHSSNDNGSSPKKPQKKTSLLASAGIIGVLIFGVIFIWGMSSVNSSQPSTSVRISHPDPTIKKPVDEGGMATQLKIMQDSLEAINKRQKDQQNVISQIAKVEPVTKADQQEVEQVSSSDNKIPQRTLYSNIPSERLKNFVLEYTNVANKGNLAKIISFYGNQVDYYNRGYVNKSFIAKDKNGYYKRWPQIDIRLISPIQIRIVQLPDIFSVEYEVEYRVNNPTTMKSIDGRATNLLYLQLMGDRVLIVKEDQKVNSRNRQ